MDYKKADSQPFCYTNSMRLFQQLLGGVAFLLGLYYLQLLFFEMVDRWNLFVPYFDALPFEILIYLLVLMLFLMAAIIYLSDEDHPVYALLFLLQVPWLLFFPLLFVPSVPLLLFYINARTRHQIIQTKILPLIAGYVFTTVAPLLSIIILFLGWGALSTSIFTTKKRSV